MKQWKQWKQRNSETETVETGANTHVPSTTRDCRRLESCNEYTVKCEVRTFVEIGTRVVQRHCHRRTRATFNLLVTM